ncbi:MAG: hypothetical protein SH808_13630, partial [Saprospiraceae bacterium]|nr:hypothetical protein [Saprospiraceae bacterium]
MFLAGTSLCEVGGEEEEEVFAMCPSTSSGTAVYPNKFRDRYPPKQAQESLSTQASSGTAIHPNKFRDRYSPDQAQGPPSALRQAQGPLSTQTSSGTATHPSKLR